MKGTRGDTKHLKHTHMGTRSPQERKRMQTAHKRTKKSNDSTSKNKMAWKENKWGGVRRGENHHCPDYFGGQNTLTNGGEQIAHGWGWGGQELTAACGQILVFVEGSLLGRAAGETGMENTTLVASVAHARQREEGSRTVETGMGALPH